MHSGGRGGSRSSDPGGSAEPQWADLWLYVYVSFFTSGFFDHIPADFVATAAPAVALLAAQVRASDSYAKFGTPE